MKIFSLLADRRFVSFADQAISSFSNLLLAVLVAHTVTASEFGIYAILASIYWVCLGSVRSSVGEPLLILREELSRKDPSTDNRVVGLGLAAGIGLAVPLLLFILLPSLRPIAVLGVFLPALLSQDVIRYIAFARRAPFYALLADLIWLVVEVVLGAGVLISHRGSIDVWVVVWGLAALSSTLIMSALLKLTPRLRGTFRWAREVSKVSIQMLTDFFVATGAQQVIVFILPLVSSLAVLGALKAAQVAAGPLQIAITAANVVTVPTVAKLSSERRFDLAARRGLQLSALIFCVGLLYTLLLAILPAAIGRAAFSASWVKGSEIAVYVGLQFAFLGALQGALVVLRGTRNTRRALIVRLWITPLNILGPLTGAALGGVEGLGIAMVATASFSVMVWWATVWRTVRSTMQPPVGVKDGDMVLSD
jgi:O-antigen/teichoic acid export membrane protein